MSTAESDIKVGERIPTHAGEYEPLSPFLVPSTAQELLSYHPELSELYELPIGLFKDAWMDLDEQLKTRGMNRDRRRSLAGGSEYALAHCDANLALSHLLFDVPDADMEAVARDVLRQYQDGRDYLPYQIEHDSDVNRGALEAGVRFVRGVNLYAGPVQGRLMETISNDEAAQYDLLRTLVGVQSNQSLGGFEGGVVLSDDMQALGWLNMLAHARTSGNGPSPVTNVLLAGLHKGRYDKLIAGDALRFLERFEVGQPVPAGLEPLHELLAIGLYMHEAGEEAVCNRLAECLDVCWPNKSRKAIEEQRRMLYGNFTRVALTFGNFSSGVIRDEDCDYTQNLHEKLRHLDGVSEELFHPVSSLGAVATEMRPPKRKQKRGGKKKAEKDPVDVGAEQARQPNTLMFIDRDGVSYPADSDEFAGMISRFLEPYNGGAQHLEEDVRLILENLSQVDTGNRSAIELGKIHRKGAVVDLGGEQKVIPVFGFQAKGLKLSSEIGRHSRILICMPEPGTIGVLGIAQSDRLDQLVKSSAVRLKHGTRPVQA